MSDLRTAAQQALEALDWMRLHLQRDHQCLHMDPAQSGIPAWINKAEITLRAALAEPNAEYERGVIDGMQRQAQSSVDKAVNRMAALAEPVQEPVAWMIYTLDGQSVCVTDNPEDFTPEHRALPLYTAPPQSKPLTEQQIWDAVQHDFVGGVGFFAKAVAITRAIEKAHGIT